MKKILFSLMVLVAAASVAFAGTRAFFSDTETSTGNVFTAGAIDLKVDSEGHYNGLICVDNKWQNCKEVPGQTNLIAYGSFEDPDVTNAAKWEIFSSIPGWDIDWESTQENFDSRPRPVAALQEYHEGVNSWSTPYGDQYAEMDSDWYGPSDPLNNEPALVKISQSITTVVGKKYQLSWAFSPRPGTSQANNVLKVRVNGVEIDEVSGAGGSNVDWNTYSKEFTADSTSTVIEFAGAGTPDSLGIFLDNIQLFEYVRDCKPSTEFTEECNSTWGLRDLNPTLDRFFSFGDIKPGDYGENTISLHVTNNPAYACINFINMHDDDPSLTEPESNPAEGGDTDEGLDQGELARNISVFMWHDDGDNVYEEEDGEPITNGIEPASMVFASSYPLANLAMGAIQPMTVKYIGLAWCAGEMGGVDTFALTCNGEGMGNEAQTDKLSVDISLYVEQERNNPDFKCPNERVGE